MHANIKIGDLTITVDEIRRTPDDTSHQIVVVDCWEDAAYKRVVVTDEETAIEVLQDFLISEGSTGLFKQLFPAFCE
jgi:hypothetical protein